MTLPLPLLSIQEAFERMKDEIVILYTLKGSTIKPMMEQVCVLVHNKHPMVPIVKVEIDASQLTREDAQRLGVMRLPQLRFYATTLLATMTGQITPSEVHEKIVSLYGK